MVACSSLGEGARSTTTCWQVPSCLIQRRGRGALLFTCSRLLLTTSPRSCLTAGCSWLATPTQSSTTRTAIRGERPLTSPHLGPSRRLAPPRCWLTAACSSSRHAARRGCTTQADDLAEASPVPLVTPRYNHMATLLADGSVLVVGGDIPPDVGLVSTELYDPATNTWMAMGETARPRTHVPTLLPDGRVLDVGWTMGDGGPSGSCTTLTTGRGAASTTAPVPGLRCGRSALARRPRTVREPRWRYGLVRLGPRFVVPSARPMVQRRWEPAVTLPRQRRCPGRRRGRKVAFTVGPPWACRQPSCSTLAPANECGSALEPAPHTVDAATRSPECL